jgi:hypothetical protein
MPIPRAPKSLVCAALLMTVALAGCFGTRLGADAPNGARLQGVWRLNRTASEDPQKIIDKMRAEALKKIHRAMNAPPPIPMDSPRRRGQGPNGVGANQQAQDDLQIQSQQQGPGGDPLRNSPMMHELRGILQRSDYLTIKQSADQLTFDYGSTVRSYSPGGHSVVSSENGVADQSSGWSGKQYVIDVKPQLGPRVTEEYQLSPDGKQLIVKLHIGPFELSKVDLTRVYDATGAVVPNTGPSND